MFTAKFTIHYRNGLQVRHAPYGRPIRGHTIQQLLNNLENYYQEIRITPCNISQISPDEWEIVFKNNNIVVKHTIHIYENEQPYRDTTWRIGLNVHC